ncbi:MAG TPA: hypothetical protein VEG34_04940 [Thermoanaerobaculia bacterium]|nr:hypothetical protein [Thermoanaerobaculia bacterium]
MSNGTDEGRASGNAPAPFEADRLRADIARSEAEARKLALEADQLERELALPFYRKPGFVKAVAAGLLALPLFWFYLDKVALPIHSAENKLLGIENEKAKIELENLEEDLESRQQELSLAKSQLDLIAQELASSQSDQDKALEQVKQEDKRPERDAQIVELQREMSERQGDLKLALARLDEIGRNIDRPIPSPLQTTPQPTPQIVEPSPVVPAPVPAPERRMRLVLDRLRVDEDGDGSSNSWQFTVRANGKEVMTLDSKRYNDDRPDVRLNLPSADLQAAGSSLQIQVDGRIPSRETFVRGTESVELPAPGSSVTRVVTAEHLPGSPKGRFRFFFRIQAVP